jgi:hypothetical protein
VALPIGSPVCDLVGADKSWRKSISAVNELYGIEQHLYSLGVVNAMSCPRAGITKNMPPTYDAATSQFRVLTAHAS